MSDRVHVMRSGVFVEDGPVEQVVGDPQHEYTRALLAAIPELGPWHDADAAADVEAAAEEPAPIASEPTPPDPPLPHDLTPRESLSSAQTGTGGELL